MLSQSLSSISLIPFHGFKLISKPRPKAHHFLHSEAEIYLKLSCHPSFQKHFPPKLGNFFLNRRFYQSIRAEDKSNVDKGENPSLQSHPKIKKYAVVGAGFAGMSVCWYLLQHACKDSSVQVTLFDALGIGGGASGASGGILHAYSPKGKLLWNGDQGWTKAMELLHVAESANQSERMKGYGDEKRKGGRKEMIEKGKREEDNHDYSDDDDDDVKNRNHDDDDDVHFSLPIAWQRGVLRPATEIKQAKNFKKSADVLKKVTFEFNSVPCGGSLLIDFSKARALVPGLAQPVDEVSLYMPEAVTIHPKRYLHALWRACMQFAKLANETFSPSTSIHFINQEIKSLSNLHQGEYDAVIFCCGSSFSSVPELKHSLPLTITHGRVLEMELDKEMNDHSQTSSEPPPSLMGHAWIAFQGEKTIIGATKFTNTTDEEKGEEKGEEKEEDNVAVTYQELIPKAAKILPKVLDWKVKGIRSGARAIPPRLPIGSIPLAGNFKFAKENTSIDDLKAVELVRDVETEPGGMVRESNMDVWLLGGLGSRGLIYHAWLGKLMADSVVLRDESILPDEVRRWKTMKT